MKTLAVVLAALLLSILPARAIDLSGIEAATMILYANGQEVCSSQVVHSADGDTILLTANHCVDGPKDTEFSIRIITKNDEREVVSYTIYTAKVFKRDAKTDLAVLRLMDDKIVLAATELATAEEADTALFKGASVLAAGYPGTFSSGMEDLVFSDGLFTGVRD
jgi:S1-C subfamily serine protease